MGVPLGIPTWLTPYRVGTVDASSIPKVRDELFVYNGLFRLTKGSNPDFFRGNELTFPPDEQIADGFYKTRFGPAFEHNGVIYRKSDVNMRYGMRRLTNKRCPEKPGYHEWLFENQERFIRKEKQFFMDLKEKYSSYFSDYLGAEEEMYAHHADPHQKRAIRIQAKNEMCEAGVCTDSDHIWLRDVLWKIKPEEWAKFGKKPRCICDLGVSASLRGFILTNILKQAQNSEIIEYKGGTFSFCKSPDPFELRKQFDLLRDPPGRFHFVYFSDDSCLSIRDKNGDVQRFNLDISSCDASHGPAIFETLLGLMPTDATRRDMEALIKQCKSTLRVVSRGDKECKLKLKPRRPILMTGSTLTTAINNLANLLIGISIVSDYEPTSGRETNRFITQAAENAGYIVTGAEPLENFEDVQFLKHSPVQSDDDQWHPMLNLGVLYRASGTCNGDLPGRKTVPLLERGRIFQRSLLRSAYPYCRFDILDQMKAAMGEGLTVAVKEFEWKVTPDSDKYPPFRAASESIRRRYRLTDGEYLELLEIAGYPCGWFFNSSAASKVLTVDYGLECVSSSNVEFEGGVEDDFGFTISLH